MYTTKQQKERVSRQIGENRTTQRMLTRSKKQEIVTHMISFNSQDIASQYLSQYHFNFTERELIWDEYLARTVGNIAPPLIDLDEQPFENGHVEDYFTSNQEYTGKELAIQLKRASNRTSENKTFITSNVGKYVDVSYTTDSKGGIDFERRTGSTQWKNPVLSNYTVDLSSGKNNDFPRNKNSKDYGMLQNGKYVQIRGASRNQHFNIANRIVGLSGNNSPDNYTWHHLLEYPKMVLVDREVHRKYGHNGGFYLW